MNVKLKTAALCCIALILSAQLSGCQTIRYYAQAVGGHTDIVLKQRNISAVLEDDAVSDQTKLQLNKIQAYRAFASQTLKLPQNSSYTRYAEIDRDYVVWNVVATPRYSVAPVTSCFVVVGCLSYRGYYAKAAALTQAEKLKKQGLDVHVAGVGAYSTLGWFSDPILNTMLSRSDAGMASLIFHELAHQQLYIKGDTQFNESFATAVASIGLRLWAKAQARSTEIDAYFLRQAKIKQIVKLILDARERMQQAYFENKHKSDLALSKLKRAQFSKLKADYAVLKQGGGGTAGYDRFFASDINHASLALFGEYHGWVDAFEAMFKQNNRDWQRFYQAVTVLSKADKVQRDKRLAGFARERK